VYEETPEYGISADFDLIKAEAQTFTWKVEGNKWYHNGKLSNGSSRKCGNGSRRSDPA
jgi:hypothetical protein